MEDFREMAMATMEDHANGAQPNYRQVAKLLQERLNNFLEGDCGELPDKKLQRLLYMAASHEVVSYAFMKPVLWGRLSRELLMLVLARLPVPEITRFRCQLSKEWTMNTEFNRACDEANPNMAALLLNAREPNEFSVSIFDFSKYIWLYEYRFRLTNRGNAPSWFDSVETETVWMPMASDGGLVCFVSTWKYTEANPLCIVVVNPLTRVQHELPPLQHVYTVPPTMVQMKVDSETKGYKVVVIVYSHTIETYDSVSGQWSRVAPSWGRVLVHACDWMIDGRICFRMKYSSSCVYDLEEGKLELLDAELLFQSEGAPVMRYALVGDRMFVLHKKEKRKRDLERGFYFITEFQSQNSAEVWVPVGTHGQCFPDEGGSFLDLHACEDVLMLRKRSPKRDNTNQICYFLNFSTGEWHELSENSLANQRVSPMCRVFWHAIP